MAITPPIASDPHSADCGPRTTSIREARSALSSSKRGEVAGGGVVGADAVDEQQV